MIYSTTHTTHTITHGSVKGPVYTIKDLPPEARPREKLLEHGPEVLSVRDLVAILIEKGTRKEGVMEMADRVLHEYGERSLKDLRDPKQLAADLDLPITRAMTLVASAELARRFALNTDGCVVIRTAEDVYNHTTDMHTLKKEQVRGLYLNAHHQIIHDEVISIGTVNTSVIHPREVFQPAVKIGAVALVLVHNHPSGETTPSEADRLVTTQLDLAGKTLGIELLDHVIVTKDSFRSLKS